MAVVEVLSDLFRDPKLGEARVDPIMKHGRSHHSMGTATNAADDESGSSYRLVDLPSHCVIHPDTIFDVENWGFATVNLGTKDDTTALGTVARSAAATYQPVEFGDANHTKRLWEVLGLSEDPGGLIGIYAHGSANADAAGDMPFHIETIWDS